MWTDLQAGVSGATVLENRPDIRQTELEMAAAKLDIKVGKCRFLSLNSTCQQASVLKLLIPVIC
jgi:hypothetical protein